MCGIAGLVLGISEPVKSEEVCTLFQHLKHRGPDDAGLLYHHQGKVHLQQGERHEGFVADVVLVHCRLSILDLSEAGWQPMGTPEGRYYIVFNGEIYNYLELRAELEALGYQFCSRSDTEVLLAAYAEWGVQGLRRFLKKNLPFQGVGAGLIKISYLGNSGWRSNRASTACIAAFPSAMPF